MDLSNSFHPHPKPEKKGKVTDADKQKAWAKYRKRKTTGEAELFQRIYDQRGGICCITGEHLEYDVNCFMHVLSKGAFRSYRLFEWNILLVKRRIHHLYDNEGRDKLLAEFPGAIIIYELKDELKKRYSAYAANLKFNR
jgi:hypothetical protein